MSPVLVHFLDVGEKEYGDAVLCELGRHRVLIDGAHPGDQVGSAKHPSIPAQLETLLGPERPVRIDLLVVTHAHQDHIGCLPALVEAQLLDVKWALVADPGFGWGQSVDGEALVPTDADPRVATVAAGLREEPLSPSSEDQAVAQLLADAVNLEQRYRSMLETLESRGTRIVRHGRDSPRALLRAFSGVGLEILGPSEEQLLVCAASLTQQTHDAVALIAEAIARDTAMGELDLYRSLIAQEADAMDAGRPGPAINLQSIVTSFALGEHKLLFAGDMQFADPQIPSHLVREAVVALRSTIAGKAPFSVVKLSHHGSDNAVDATVLAELGQTPLYGICAGEESTSHPNRRVLALLDARRKELGWVRTDRNGLVSIELNGAPRVSPARGELSDPRPNAPDAPVLVPEPTATTVGVMAPIERTGTQLVRAAVDDDVEVVTRLPPSVRRVIVTVEVERSQGSPTSAKVTDALAFTLAGGRPLPPLLFVTNRTALASNVGVAETDAILAGIDDHPNITLLDELPVDHRDPAASAQAVGEQLRRLPGTQGVVLVGGPAVVPAIRMDCLPQALRTRLRHTNDPDDFIVWSDADYGDNDSDLIAELPVTRVPDGNSAEFMIAALSATDEPRHPGRIGIRNAGRPFAEEIFPLLPGADPLLVSEPTTHVLAPTLGGQHVYLMLHGSDIDSTRFWGENSAELVEAVNLTNVARPAGRVVFTGCCWGAMIADQPALRTIPGTTPASKPVGSSLALAFLEHGSTAFVGCTGAHYSPLQEPFGYFGGPMHEAFWTHIVAGAPPAQALFEAKVDYVAGFPHGLTTTVGQAIEHKILHQYTCLGLGW
jgi:beta-lactamase superfamily II metal-dependent hydrolase